MVSIDSVSADISIHCRLCSNSWGKYSCWKGTFSAFILCIRIWPQHSSYDIVYISLFFTWCGVVSRDCLTHAWKLPDCFSQLSAKKVEYIFNQDQRNSTHCKRVQRHLIIYCWRKQRDKIIFYLPTPVYKSMLCNALDLQCIRKINKSKNILSWTATTTSLCYFAYWIEYNTSRNSLYHHPLINYCWIVEIGR